MSTMRRNGQQGIGQQGVGEQGNGRQIAGEQGIGRQSVSQQAETDMQQDLLAPVTLAAENLGKSFDGTTVLEATDLQVQPGTSVAFMSPSGSGKSTLLSMLGLLLAPTTGRVLVNGEDTTTLDDAAVSRLRLHTFGFVFQHTQMIGSLRALDNVCVPASLARQDFAISRARAEALLDHVGLGERLRHYPYQLSIGQKRRVAIARALMLQPSILIADEPTNDLDEKSAAGVTDILFDHVKRGGILLMATHDRNLAERASCIMRLEGKTFVEG